MKNCDACNGFGLFLARVPLGIVLALAGYNKFQYGVENFVNGARSMGEQFMPANLANMYLHAVPYAEVGLGGMLILGLLTRMSGLLSALMLISFGLATGGGGTNGFFNFHPENASKLFQAPFTYGVLALVAFFAGPGTISLDHLLFGARRA